MNARDCVVSALLLGVLLSGWMACRVPTVDARGLLAVKGEPHADVLNPVAGVATDSAGAEVKAFAVVDRSGSHCDVLGGLPSVVVGASGRPVIGQPFRVTWTSRPTSPPEHPPALMVLVIANRPAIASPIAGAPGCMLSVHPDHLLVPQQGGLLTRDGGRMFLDWTPTANLMGVPFWVQAIMSDTRNDAGLVVSPTLFLVVGVF